VLVGLGDARVLTDACVNIEIEVDGTTSNSFKKIKRENFTPLLNEVLEISATPQTLSNSFRACGLCPLNPDAVDYSKIKTPSNKTGTTNNNSEHNLGYKLENLKKCITIIENHIGPEKTNRFKNVEEQWIGDREGNANTTLKIIQ
jgi:hypothetical protein